MSDNSDISDFESTIEDDIEEKSNSSRSSKKSSDEDEDDDPEMVDSVRASTSRNKSFQRKSRNDVDGARITRKVRYVYPPKPGEKDERISPRFMTPFELAALIGERAEMISRGGKIHPKYANYPTVDLIKISALEIEDSTIPFPLMLKRPIDNPTHPTLVEIFKVRELLTPNQRLTNHIDKYTPVSNWRVFD